AAPCIDPRIASGRLSREYPPKPLACRQEVFTFEAHTHTRAAMTQPRGGAATGGGVSSFLRASRGAFRRCGIHAAIAARVMDPGGAAMHNFLANNRDELIARCKTKVAQRP